MQYNNSETLGLVLMFCIFVTKLSGMERMNQLLSLLHDDPNDLFVLFAIAKEHEKSGDFEKAIAFYEKIIGIDKEYVGVYYHLAHLYAEDGEIDKAYQIYDAGIDVAKKLSDLHALSELQNARKNLEMENL